MANLDTYAKRKSSVSILMPFMPPGVIPGGNAQSNRQAGAWSYSGAGTIIILTSAILSAVISQDSLIATISQDVLSATILQDSLTVTIN